MSGRQARDAAIGRIASSVGPAWLKAAGDFLIIYAMEHKTFGSEDVRAFAYDMGLPRPHDERAWGPVIARALSKKNRVIEFKKTGHAKNTQAHLRPTNVWKSLV